MSIRMLNWAFHHVTGLPSTQKFVLVSLADRADEDGIYFASVRYLVEKTGLNRKTILSALAALEEKGIVTDTGGRLGKTHSVKVLRLSGPDFGTASAQPPRPVDKVGRYPQAVPKTEGSGPDLGTGKRSQKRDSDPNDLYRNDPRSVFSGDKRESGAMAFSSDIADRLRCAAPGWCPDFLESKFRDFIASKVAEGGEPPRYPDKAILKWAPRFTKGKRP